MEITFLGHQTWLVTGSSGGSVLVDPVLVDRIGPMEIGGSHIYPPRRIDVLGLAHIDAIVISHEHSDHFDIRSLDKLPRVPIYLGALVVEPVAEAARRLGFTVIRHVSSASFAVADLKVALYACDLMTAYWESRVSQVHFEEISTPASFLIGVDALISEEFIVAVKGGKVRAPNTVAVSNNSQVTPAGVIGALQSCADDHGTAKSKRGISGLEVVSSLIEYVSVLPETRNVLICGGGFMKNHDDFGPFPFSDQDELGRIMDGLSFGPRVIGLLPGQQVKESGSELGEIGEVSWIVRDTERLDVLRRQRADFIKRGRPLRSATICPPFATEDEVIAAMSRCEQEIGSLAPHLLVSPVGRHAFEAWKAHGASGSNFGFIFALTEWPGVRRKLFGLNFQSGLFERHPDVEDYLAAAAFGIELSLRDFDGLIRGEVQIWDLAGAGVKAWYQGPEFESPVAFMYSYYGENSSPELLSVALNSHLDTIVRA